MRSRDREAAIEDKKRYAGNPAICGGGRRLLDEFKVVLARKIPPHVFRIQAARGSGVDKRFVIGEVRAFREKGVENIFDDRRPLARFLGPMDDAVNVDRVRLPLDFLEMKLDAFFLAEFRDALMRGAEALITTEFAREIIFARHAFARYLRIEKIRAPVNFGFDIRPQFERGFETPLAEVTPRADDVGDDIDHDTLWQMGSA